MTQRLCLNMIERNEMRNLPRCLKALAPHVSCYAIVDTGSTDGSAEYIEQFFAERNIPGVLQRVAFEDVAIEIDGTHYFNFGEARNVALRLARAERGKALPEWDYVLFCDADMELTVRKKGFPPLTKPAYGIMQDNSVAQYWNIRLLHHAETCEYKGVTHECIIASTTPDTVVDVWYRDHETGDNRKNKYERDIKLLSWGLRQEPDNSRYVFYMAQSLHGLGMLERARDFCQMRAQMGGLEEEVWWSKLQIAHLSEKIGDPPEIVERYFVSAFLDRPNRAEVLFGLAKHHEKRGEHPMALIYARTAALMPKPFEVLPVDSNVYEWAALDTWLCAAAMCDNMIEARIAAKQLLKRRVPKDDYARVKGNIELVLNGRKSDEKRKPQKGAAPNAPQAI